MNCTGLITQGLSKTCKNHPFGFEKKGVLVNRPDVNFGSVTYATGKTNIIENFPLNSGATGFEIVQFGTKPFNGTKKSFVSKESSPGKMTKTVQFFVPGHDPAEDEGFVEAIMNGDFVMILENKDKNETTNNAAFEVFGFHNGLHATAMEQDTYGDYGSGWLITLEETEAPSAAMYLFATSYAATKTLVEGLLPTTSQANQ